MSENPSTSNQHPSTETWIEYHEGRVSEEARQRLQRHLSRCRRCVDLVLDLDAFVEPEARQEGAIGDFERAAAWRAVRGTLEHRPAAGRATRWLAAASVAASLLFAAVGLSAWTQQRDTVTGLEAKLVALTRVQPDVPSVDLRPGARQRSSGGVDATVDLPADGCLLVLHLEDEADDPAYELRFFDAAGTEVDGVGLSMTDAGSFELLLPAGALDAGSYELRLFGLGDEGERQLETYLIRLP